MSNRLTQAYVEYEWREPPASRVTQMYAEYEYTDAEENRVTQFYVEYEYFQRGTLSYGFKVQHY